MVFREITSVIFWLVWHPARSLLFFPWCWVWLCCRKPCGYMVTGSLDDSRAQTYLHRRDTLLLLYEWSQLSVWPVCKGRPSPLPSRTSQPVWQKHSAVRGASTPGDHREKAYLALWSFSCYSQQPSKGAETDLGMGAGMRCIYRKLSYRGVGKRKGPTQE